MKTNSLKLFFLLSATFLLLKCHKDTIEVDLPSEVELGETVVYFNGELTDMYKPDFRTDTIYEILSFGFVNNTGDIINSFGFYWLPIAEGNFQLTTERIPQVKAISFFSQTIDEDLDGYDYKLIDAEEGFFNIEHLDTVKREVKGRFRAKFKRTSKNGNKNLGLPKFIQVDGVFNEPYQYY